MAEPSSKSPAVMDENAVLALEPTSGLKTKKSGLFRRLTNKLKPPTASAGITPPPKSPTGGNFSRARPGPSLPNDLVAKERRQAALRARGLLPPDLSQLEREMDQRNATVVSPTLQEPDGESAARKIQQEWLAKNTPSLDASPSEATYPPTLSKPNFSKARPVADIVSDDHEEGTIGEQTETSVALAVNNIPSEDSPAPEDPAPLISNTPDLSQDLPSDAYLFHSPNSSVLLPDPRLLASKRPRPTGITTTPLLHRSPSNASQSGNRSVSNQNYLLTKQASLSNKTSLPALSPTKSTSSCSSVETPPQHEDQDQDPAIVERSSSGRSTGSAAKLDFIKTQVKTEISTVHFSPVEAAEAEDQVHASQEELNGFEAFVEKRERRHRRRSTGVTDSRNNSISSNRLSGDFLRKTEITNSASAPGTLGVPQPKRFASLRRKVSKLGANPRPPTQTKQPPLPAAASGLVRRPTIGRNLTSRATMLNEMKGIDDEESRRLCEVAFF